MSFVPFYLKQPQNIIIKSSMSSKRNQSSDAQSNFIYRLLPEARPLRVKQPVIGKSAFPFLIDSPTVITPQDSQQQPMEIIPQDRNSTTDEIGNYFAQLFKQPLYQSYEQLNLSNDNIKFATCSILKAAKRRNWDSSYLIFESRFESGNLAIVSRSQNNDQTYYLALQKDTNSRATCQWYYFSVQNGQNIGSYTFNIVNLVKSYSAYQNGMKPCVYSTQAKKGWRRDGYNISYRKNSIPYYGQRTFYTFQFCYNFIHKNDKVYFAYSYPYTFTHLQNFITEIQSNYSTLVQVKNLTKTIKGNPINMISITNPQKYNNFENGSSKKQMIMICARVHPGQTNSSFVCQQLIRFLVSNSDEANNIRRHYMIKVIPFLNPDGVIHGNYRTSIVGHDLNRRWKKPDRDLHPQIWSIKNYLTQCEYRKMLFVDLHGHSKKRSSFMYGCLNRQSPYLCKQFPFILSKKGFHFCYYNCNFSTPVERQGTSRMNVWRQFGVDYSYTMQVSFCGPIKSRHQFTIKDYKRIGFEFGRVMSLYFCGKKYCGDNQELKRLLNQFYSEDRNLNQGISDSSGSQSGEQDQIQIKQEIKRDQIAQSVKQTKKQLSGVLTKYLTETKMKWNRKQYQNKSFRKQEKSLSNLKLRRQLSPSRISIQKIDLTQQLNKPYVNFALVKGGVKLSSRDPPKISHRKKSYGPYSFSKNKIQKQGNNQEQQSLMLPKVLRQQELRYRKYRKNEKSFEACLGNEQVTGLPAHYSSKMNNSKTSRQISLAEKILQNTMKMQQSTRYWSKQ